MFFTTLVGTLVGLRSADRTSLDLIHAYGGGRGRQLRKVRLRAACRACSPALRIAAPAAMLGAIIGEYLGAESGLGVAMINSQQSLAVERTWGIALVATALSGAGYGLTALVGAAHPLGTAGETIEPGGEAGPGRTRQAAGAVGSVGDLRRLAGTVSGFDLDPFLTRGPLDVWRYLLDPRHDAERALLAEASRITARDAVIGMVAGTVAAVAAALAFALWRSFEQTVMPIAMALRAVPLVAMTPLIALVFGRGLLSVTVIAGIVTFFPVLVNVSLALRAVPASALDLMHAYGASPFTTLRRVQVPSALPALFAAMRVAAPLALVGALLAEWLTTGRGLGYLMLQSVTTFELDRMWTAVTIVTVASILLYTVISVLEQLTLARYAPDQTRRAL